MTKKRKVYVNANQYNKAIEFIAEHNKYLVCSPTTCLNALINELACSKHTSSLASGGFLVTIEKVSEDDFFIEIWVDLIAGSELKETEKEWVRSVSDGSVEIVFQYK